MIKYACWVGGGVLGALLGIGVGSKLGYVGGIFVGDRLYHYISYREHKNDAKA